MKKNEYIAPKMEIVEITQDRLLLAGSNGSEDGGGPTKPGVPGTSSSRYIDDED